MAATLDTGAFENAEAIYKGLLAMGLSTNAAAGVAGNIYQESHGNPSSPSGAGGGLFGETTANGGSTSGGSLTEQLAALASYIAKFGSVGDINGNASTPQAAATYFCDKYEKPGIPDIQTRIDAAEWVAAAAKSGNWGTSNGTPPPAGGGGSGLFSWPSEITGFFGDAQKFIDALLWLAKPASWVRIGAFLVGVALLLFGVHALIAVGSGQPIISMPKTLPIPVPV